MKEKQSNEELKALFNPACEGCCVPNEATEMKEAYNYCFEHYMNCPCVTCLIKMTCGSDAIYLCEKYLNEWNRISGDSV